jgi:hypothetical protein
MVGVEHFPGDFLSLWFWLFNWSHDLIVLFFLNLLFFNLFHLLNILKSLIALFLILVEFYVLYSFVRVKIKIKQLLLHIVLRHFENECFFLFRLFARFATCQTARLTPFEVNIFKILDN